MNLISIVTPCYNEQENVAEVHRRVREIMSTHYPDIIDPGIDAALRARYDIRLPRELMRAGNARWPAA